MPRTEQDKVLMSPLKVKFGEKDYEIRPLRARKAQKWRQQLCDEIGPIVEKLQPVAVSKVLFVQGLSAAMMQFPEKVYELLFTYAPYLPQDEILDEDKGATEEQLAYAFAQIWEMVYQDFLAQLGAARQLLMPTSQPLASASN
jgi:hypothetical protein